MLIVTYELPAEDKKETANVTNEENTALEPEGANTNTTSEMKENDENIQVQQGQSIEDYKEDVEPQTQEKESEQPVQQVSTPTVQSPASRPSSVKKSLFEDDDDEDLFTKIPVKKATPKKNSLFDDDDDLFK